MNLVGISESGPAIFSKEGTLTPLRSFSFSLLTHAALFMGLLLFKTPSFSNVPRGVHRMGGAVAVELVATGPLDTQKTEEVQTPAPEKTAALFKKKTSSKKSQEDKKAPAALGFEKGSRQKGALGRADGFSASVKQHYLYELQVLIDRRKVYPPMAQRMGEAGKILVEFKILKDGRIEEVRVAQPSHFERLNQAALHLIEDIKQYRPLPESLQAEHLLLKVPVEYVLQ